MDEMWRPPVNRLMRSLDRGFFKRTIDLKAAQVFDNKNISKLRSTLEKSKDALARERLLNVRPDPNPELAKVGRKCILLRPEIREAQTNAGDDAQGATMAWPHSPTVTQLVDEKLVSIIPYQLELDYSYWTYHDIISAILPVDEQGEIPSGFSLVGHVAHLNLRDEYLKYKNIIAEIILDKNTGVRTVINKVDDVGEESEFRTFKYEVLAGPDDLNVTVSEEGCTFKFDYSKVYWNTRLNTEHRRLVSIFKEGEAVCDVMAGIGPFAVPAGKKRIFVWANDLNPDSYTSMVDAVQRNKVHDYVKPFNTDGRAFIRDAIASLAQTQHTANVLGKPPKRDPKSPNKPPPPEIVRTITQPKTFQHFVMNLPASAITFLPSFIGSYTPQVRQALGGGDIPMPLIHVYCFSTKSDDNVAEGFKICEEISQQLGYTFQPGSISEGKVEIFDVRDVAPKKRMFCASFRLPEEVAFRTNS